MIAIEDTLISNDLISESFVCDLKKCKGICCVEGEAGAPLEEEECNVLETIYPQIKSYLNIEGQNAIEQKGKYIVDDDGDWVTPLIGPGDACAYAVFSKDGTASCAIENAYNDGIINFKKPISCHLYPIRIEQYKSFTAVNYHQWEICSPACDLGKNLKMPVYIFVKEALIRRFGSDWYNALSNAAKKVEKE